MIDFVIFFLVLLSLPFSHIYTNIQSSKRKRVLKITHKMDGSAHTPISEEQETIDENEQESFAVEYVEILDEKTDGNLIAAYKKGSS